MIINSLINKIFKNNQIPHLNPLPQAGEAKSFGILPQRGEAKKGKGEGSGNSTPSTPCPDPSALNEINARLEKLEGNLDKAITGYRLMLINNNPDILPEMITGDCLPPPVDPDQLASSAEKPALRKCSSAVSACEIFRSFITQKLRQSTNE